MSLEFDRPFRPGDTPDPDAKVVAPRSDPLAIRAPCDGVHPWRVEVRSREVWTERSNFAAGGDLPNPSKRFDPAGRNSSTIRAPRHFPEPGRVVYERANNLPRARVDERDLFVFAGRRETPTIWAPCDGEYPVRGTPRPKLFTRFDAPTSYAIVVTVRG